MGVLDSIKDAVGKVGSSVADNAKGIGAAAAALGITAGVAALYAKQEKQSFTLVSANDLIEGLKALKDNETQVHVNGDKVTIAVHEKGEGFVTRLRFEFHEDREVTTFVELVKDKGKNGILKMKAWFALEAAAREVQKGRDAEVRAVKEAEYQQEREARLAVTCAFCGHKFTDAAAKKAESSCPSCGGSTAVV